MKQSKYAMSEAQVETLASERTQHMVATDASDMTYLRVLIAATQALMGPKKGKRPETSAQLAALESISVPYYNAVIRGVTTPDIALDATLEADETAVRLRERNRRATFARTAKSTLSVWIDEGGDIRALDVGTVTKGELRASVLAARSERGAEPVANSIERAKRAILLAVAREEPDKARERLTAVIEALQAALDELPEDEPLTHDTTTIRTRVGTPTFTQPARVLNRGA